MNIQISNVSPHKPRRVLTCLHSSGIYSARVFQNLQTTLYDDSLDSTMQTASVLFNYDDDDHSDDSDDDGINN